MDKRESKKEDLNVRLTKSLKEQYKTYCKKNDLDMSKHIRTLIEKCLNREIK